KVVEVRGSSVRVVEWAGKEGKWGYGAWREKRESRDELRISRVVAEIGGDFDEYLRQRERQWQFSWCWSSFDDGTRFLVVAITVWRWQSPLGGDDDRAGEIRRWLKDMVVVVVALIELYGDDGR
nr:hypothetical protein [Tanacetum cinerariifolium]